MNIEELKKDLAEVKELSEKATRKRVQDALSMAQLKIEADVRSLEEKLRLEQAKAACSVPVTSGSTTTVEPRRYLVELNEYAWDQSDKFVKIFATLDGVQGLTEAEVQTIFTDTSMILTVKNLNNKDYRLTINNLHSPIVVDKSYRKIKTDMVAIYMKKQKEFETWSHLTRTEKRLKNMQESVFKDESESNKDDPTAGMMDLMKKMYQSGDPEMKRMIAKAWTENQQKSQEGGGMGMGGMGGMGMGGMM